MHSAYAPAWKALKEQLVELDSRRQKLLVAISQIEALPEPGAHDAAIARTVAGRDPVPPASEEDPTYADASEVVIREAGRPMHIDEIAVGFKAKGWFEDKDFTDRLDRNSLFSALNRNAQKGRTFVKTEAATYGLAEWVEDGDDAEIDPIAPERGEGELEL